MLRVTVELLPGGRQAGRKELARLLIGNIRLDALSDYRVRLTEKAVEGARVVELKDYPRYAPSVWDLVARCITKALTGEEAMPPRPAPLEVPVHIADGLGYVRIADIPEPARTLFLQNMDGSTYPVIPGEGRCAYAWDWAAFLRGER